MTPKHYLFGYAEMLAALDLDNTPQNRRRVQLLNRDADGPIACTGQGKQPRVERGRLLAWWNGLEARWDELDRRQRDRRQSVARSHPYARAGTVYPEINGHATQRP